METMQNRKSVLDGKTERKSCKENTNSELDNERSTGEDEKRICPLCFIEIDFLMAHQMCPRCDTHLLIFLAMMHDSSYWCAVGGEQYISQCFTTFTYSTEAKVMME